MAIIYEENPPPYKGRITPYEDQDAVGSYLKHYENYMYLNFLAKNSDRPVERYQANKELQICERKMLHWRRHRNWNLERAEQGIALIKKKWRQKEVHS